MYRNFLPVILGARVIVKVCSLLLGLALLQFLPACAEELTPALQGAVDWVYDGDTLKIDNFGKVRLIGIDSPERENSNRDQFLLDQGVSIAKQRQAYQLAKQFNIKNAKGKKVVLEFDESRRDRHNRLLAYVYLPDGRLLNRLLVEQGLAVVYRRFSFEMKTDFLSAEEHARRSGVGLWAKGR